MSDPQKPTAIEQLVLHRMASMEDTLGDLADQVRRLVLIEERQSQTAAAIERAFKTIAELETRLRPIEQLAVTVGQMADMDKRVRSLELVAPITARTNIWVERAVIAVVSGSTAVAFLLR